jgi:hypothetical protein
MRIQSGAASHPGRGGGPLFNFYDLSDNLERFPQQVVDLLHDAADGVLDGGTASSTSSFEASASKTRVNVGKPTIIAFGRIASDRFL